VTSFQKNVVFVTGAITVVVCVVFGISFGIQSYNVHLQEQAKVLDEQKTAWLEYNIRSLKALSVVGVFTDEEQKRLDNAGNDVEHLRQALIDIHQGRITLWQDQLDDALQRKQRLQALVGFSLYPSYGGKIEKDESEAKDQIGGYAKGLNHIEDWHPIKFEEYVVQKKAGTLIPGLDDFDEAKESKDIWENPSDPEDAIKQAPKGEESSYSWVEVLKKSTITGFNDDARKRGFSASWFLCSSGGALCADIPSAQASSYESLVFSSGFHPDEVSGDPIATGLWRQGYWAVVIHTTDAKGSDVWVAKSPSPSGWVSLKKGMAAFEKQIRDDEVDSETGSTR
jgi:hypothetical protein